MNNLVKKDRETLKYLVDRYGSQTLLNESELSRKVLPWFGIGALALSPLMFDGNNNKDAKPRENVVKVNNQKKKTDSNTISYTDLTRKTELATEYIKDNLAKNGKTIGDVPFDIDDLILSCHKYDYDLPLMMAQLQIESHFGTDGKRGKKTNSVFSIGLYDDGRNLIHYNSVKDAIDHYIKIMKEDYLQNGKVTVEQLLLNFVNKNGHRYAQDPNYERNVRLTRNKIIRNYPELASFE